MRCFGPTNERSTSFTPANISARPPTVATDWYDKYRAVLRDDGKGVEKVVRAMRYLRGKATTKAAVAERELRFFRKHRRRMRYASLKAKGCVSGVVEAANKVLVNQRMKRARWSRRPEHPHLQGDVGPLRRRVAGDDRNGGREQQPERPRGLTTAIPLPQTKPEYKMQNAILTKIDLHPNQLMIHFLILQL